jgi:hypothetical protein
MIATATSTVDFGDVDSSFTKVRGRKQPVEKLLYAPSEHFSGTQGPRYRSVLALISECLNAVLDYRLVLQRLFNRLENSQKAYSASWIAPVLLTGQDRLTRPRSWTGAIDILW